MDPVLKAAVSVVLGLAVIAGLGFYLVATNATQRLDDDAVYTTALDETNAYARIYDEVLPDEAWEDETGDLRGGVAIRDQDDVVDVLRQIFPPDYLQEQTEANVGRFTAFLRHERDDLELYVEMEAPLGRIEPAVLGKVHAYIADEMEIEAPQSPGCSQPTVERMALAYAERYTQLADGMLPLSAPSLNTLPRECRRGEFDRWFDIVLEQPEIDPDTATALRDAREEIRSSFVDGDTRDFFKDVAGTLVKLQIDDAVADFRQDLQPNDRLDLVEWLTDESDDADREDFDEGAESVRDGLSDINGIGRFLALAAVVVGSLLLAAVHLPRREDMLRWPGVALLAGGGLSLVAGLLLNSGLPAIIRAAAEEDVSSSDVDAPDPVVELAADVLEVFTREVTSGYMPAVVAVMVVGAVLIAASLLHGRITAMFESPPRPPRGGG